MGTRGLTMVISKEQTKVAQYGQWDHYPEGQGLTILKFLLSLKGDYNGFQAKVDKLRWITDDEMKQVDETTADEFESQYPNLDRDTGGEILSLIHTGKIIKEHYLTGKKTLKHNVVFLQDSSSFAADSLFCEWAYVIDLDKNTFEVYEGFNKTPLNVDERFYGISSDVKSASDNDIDNEYYPVKHLKTYSLLSLPSVEEFLEEMNGLLKVEEDEEDSIG